MRNIAFTHLNLFDGRLESDLQEDFTILVELNEGGSGPTGTIQEIGPASEISFPSGTDVFDLSGKYVIPGLINAHAHLFSDGQPRALVSASEKILGLFLKLMGTRLGRAYLKTAMRKNAQTALNSGVTTIRTVGDFNNYDVELRDEFGAGKYLGPRLVVSGEMICVTGGHGAYMAQVIDNPWDGRKAVRNCLRHGSDLH